MRLLQSAITLVEINGQIVNNTHIISWETATEINNTGFDLETSEDGRNFSSIGFIPSKAANGNSIQTLTYSFTDAKSPDGKKLEISINSQPSAPSLITSTEFKS